MNKKERKKITVPKGNYGDKKIRKIKNRTKISSKRVPPFPQSQRAVSRKHDFITSISPCLVFPALFLYYHGKSA